MPVGCVGPRVGAAVGRRVCAASPAVGGADGLYVKTTHASLQYSQVSSLMCGWFAPSVAHSSAHQSQAAGVSSGMQSSGADTTASSVSQYVTGTQSVASSSPSSSQNRDRPRLGAGVVSARPRTAPGITAPAPVSPAATGAPTSPFVSRMAASIDLCMSTALRPTRASAKTNPNDATKTRRDDASRASPIAATYGGAGTGPTRAADAAQTESRLVLLKMYIHTVKTS